MDSFYRFSYAEIKDMIEDFMKTKVEIYRDYDRWQDKLIKGKSKFPQQTERGFTVYFKTDSEIFKLDVCELCCRVSYVEEFCYSVYKHDKEWCQLLKKKDPARIKRFAIQDKQKELKKINSRIKDTIFNIEELKRQKNELEKSKKKLESEINQLS